MGEMKNSYKISAGRREGKRPHGRPGRSKWQDNIRMDFVEIDREGVD
jgi:hypothetical protein